MRTRSTNYNLFPTISYVTPIPEKEVVPIDEVKKELQELSSTNAYLRNQLEATQIAINALRIGSEKEEIKSPVTKKPKDNSISDCNKTIDEDLSLDDLIEYHFSDALGLERQGKVGEALINLNEAIKICETRETGYIDLTFHELLEERSKLYFKLNMFYAALEDAYKSLFCGYSTLSRMRDCYLALNEIENACNFVKRIIEESAKDGRQLDNIDILNLNFVRYETYLTRGMKKEAEEVLSQIFGLNNIFNLCSVIREILSQNPNNNAALSLQQILEDKPI